MPAPTVQPTAVFECSKSAKRSFTLAKLGPAVAHRQWFIEKMPEVVPFFSRNCTEAPTFGVTIQPMRLCNTSPPKFGELSPETGVLKSTPKRSHLSAASDGS